MLTYIALVWDIEDRSQAEAADRLRASVRVNLADWRTALDRPGLFVSFATKAGRGVEQVYPLSRNQGVVLGKLFERRYVETDQEASAAPVPVSFDERLSNGLIADGGLTLRDKFWGSYVAFLARPSSGTHCVLRDPTGRIPCQLLNFRGVSVYFVRLVDVERVAPIRLAFNRHFLAGAFVAPVAHSGETAYEGVSTVLPGERVEHGRGSVRRAFFWNAIELANSDDTQSLVDAQLTTRRIVRSCVHAWASCFDRIFLQLSGGLDSTIVAACLASAPTRPQVLSGNFHCKYETSDERQFAREVAARCGFELLEISAEDHEVVDLAPREARAVVPPSITAPSNTWRETCQRLAGKGIGVLFRGDGGDELFYRGGALPDTVDLAFERGLTMGLWNAALNDARIARTSVWEVLRQVGRHGLLKRPHNWRFPLWANERLMFLNPEVRHEACRDETYWHPLFRGDVRCAPGKLGQAHALLQFTNRFYVPEPIDNQPRVISPLVSQPHIEFALRTPVWVLRAGGRDRSLARGAFQEHIPKNILYRKYKSLGTASAGNWIAEKGAAARELMLDGYLVRERIVDRHYLETNLAKAPSHLSSISPHLLLMLCIEVWIRDANVRGAMAA